MSFTPHLGIGGPGRPAGGPPRPPAGPVKPLVLDRAAVVSTVVAGIAFGLLLSIVPGGQRRLSIDLWLVGVAAWAGVGLVRRALSPVPTVGATLRLPIRFRPRPDPEDTFVPRGVATLEGGILASTDNPRSYDHRLRPRLRAVAEHQLRINHGVDPTTEPERAAEALGDVAWLVDDGVSERSPRPDEIERLLDRLSP